MLPDTPAPALRLGIDHDALRSNWLTLDRMSGSARAGAAVKANGYGVGVSKVVPVLHDAGCRDFFVAHWSEVPAVLELVSADLLSVLHGPLTDADVLYARACGVKPVINSLDQARRWLNGGGGRCDIMVDTGINRLGVPLSQTGDEAVQALDIDILLSHLASAEEDSTLNSLQCQRWQQARSAIPHLRASLANSSGIALGSAFHGDVTRPGLALYGGIPRTEMASQIRQVVRPEVAIMQVREVPAGATIGYNATFTAPVSMRVGTIAIGYADGYLRCWSGRGRFSAGGQDLPVIGRVSMDMTTLDLTGASHLGEGDWVTAEYALPEASRATGLSQYELLTVLGQRFAR